MAKGRNPAAERKEAAAAELAKRSRDSLTLSVLTDDWNRLHLAQWCVRSSRLDQPQPVPPACQPAAVSAMPVAATVDAIPCPLPELSVRLGPVQPPNHPLLPIDALGECFELLQAE